MVESPGTPGQAARAASAARKPGRPSLSELKRREVRLEIARAAVRLFRAQGVEQTSAADIAAEAGVSPRTLWRYVPSKEEAVTVLFTLAAEGLATRLRELPPGEPLSALLLGEPWQDQMTPEIGRLVREATRLTQDEPALRKVAHQAAFAFQSGIAAAFAAREGRAEARLEDKVHAAMLLATLAVVEQEAAWCEPADEPRRSELLRRGLRVASAGLPL
ncbi:TetR/AcrR family transcriptional regulator [Streptomyces sp. SPB074]|uniref:TetR/AcrR family transcriptional regulator n=1 Tax=Streptomyces sp. (strain SPB074) TaxID=465543 RepID=UPI00017F1AB6|nr:TetR/AcrR family transcriptional regulator [Streptomyces sp. SPB074]EDY42297.1 TetR-family transcriptional regulator [Streptomyces sp. SPB074]